jgi:hypothetical protein
MNLPESAHKPELGLILMQAEKIRFHFWLIVSTFLLGKLLCRGLHCEKAQDISPI